MSNLPPALSTSKAAGNTPQLSQTQASQSNLSAASESFVQRRSGGSGSFGSGASSRAAPSPRNAQASRKQHKGSKRLKLVDDDAIIESAAMRNTNSRKGQTSITHLMNFSLPPRPQNSHHYHSGSSRTARRNPIWGMGSGYHAVDKARYIHANYRFIVDPRGNYRTQSIDADIHLDWNNVLQVLASAQSQSAECPICLNTPVAPRMAKCGHIFCLPCLLRYMHSEDSTAPQPEKKARWKKCPICHDSIYTSDTRPVRWYMGQEGEPPQEGHDVVLRLVTRSAGSTLALPRDGADAISEDEDVPWHFAAEVMEYARMMRGTEDYMNEQFDFDMQELKRQGMEDEAMFGEDNIEWMRKAIKLLRESKEKVQGMGNPPSMHRPAEPKVKRPPIVFHNSETQDGRPFTQMGSAIPVAADAQPPANHAPNKENVLESAGASSITQSHQQPNANQTPSEYFFYQALLHYYLSPLDIRILKAAFGAFSSFPSTILPRIEHISTGHVIDDDLRKRTKYLAHLPYGCEVAFLECDWTDTVGPEVLEHFKPDIERRRKKHQEKVNREEKSRLKAEKEETDRYRRSNRRGSVSNDRFSADDFAPLAAASSGAALSASADVEDGTSNSPPWSNRHQGQGSSFASLASPGTSPSAARTVWGTNAITPSSPVLHAGPDPDHDDGWLQGWEKDLLAQDENLAVQVAALSLEGENAGKGAGAQNASGKKGKKKKITLMSTNVRRGA